MTEVRQALAQALDQLVGVAATIEQILNSELQCEAGAGGSGSSVTSKAAFASPERGRRSSNGRYFVEILGERAEVPTLGEAVRFVVDVLGDVYPELFERAHELRGAKRRYLARSAEQLYPSSPHLAKRALRTKHGWWVPNNISLIDAYRIVGMLAGMAKLEWGKDIVFSDRRFLDLTALIDLD